MNNNIHTDQEVQRRRGSPPTRAAQLVQQPPGPCQARLPAGSYRPAPDQQGPRRRHPPLGQSASYNPGDKSLHYRAHWSSDSDEDSQSDWDCVYRVMLLGDHGVGKSSLAGIFAGVTEKEDPPFV